MICNLHGDHGSKHRADEIQKPGDVVHGEQHSGRSADDLYTAMAVFLPSPFREGFRGNTADHASRKVVVTVENTRITSAAMPSPRLHHDHGDVSYSPGKMACAHADDVHPSRTQQLHESQLTQVPAPAFPRPRDSRVMRGSHSGAWPPPAPPPRRRSWPRRGAHGAARRQKITLHSTSVRRKRAAMVSLLIQPRSVMPTTIHTMMRTPMTRHQTQCPTEKMPPMASAPS